MKTRASVTKNAPTYAGETDFTCWRMAMDRYLNEQEMEDENERLIITKHALRGIAAEFLGAREEQD